MYDRWLEALRELTRWKEAEASRLIEELCRNALVVVLFGSRARGDFTPLSDWDLLAVIERGEYRLEQRRIGQVVWLPLDKLEEVLERSMVILDAVVDGRPLCGDFEVFARIKAEVEEYIKRRGLVRTRHGWVAAP
ncbi:MULTISPECIES: nucleotidyltransferase domain-containing protein [Pyrobaculum]|uniref:Polymerase nucleotidyl transferase domain-containing protein n=2 Tax=Pyrobaculum aerophilum TaxID=13773 RepID=Q8ZWA4_PYRAE|nr:MULTISPECIES: nucleotidyltransferase domain-containing protein [Pyrobaculum]AAL63798.1 conserved hypothetical protein [Pyrobaculum aerophilum str. IM2]MCX8136758.1 nucleotidyltransferase domain-containing protein [Pyrobaculum aerophilum]HII46624.1 nucleotidyltransferase domain-containing protein [Pyrobaculum aerophilum]